MEIYLPVLVILVAVLGIICGSYTAFSILSSVDHHRMKKRDRKRVELLELEEENDEEYKQDLKKDDDDEDDDEDYEPEPEKKSFFSRFRKNKKSEKTSYRNNRNNRNEKNGKSENSRLSGIMNRKTESWTKMNADIDNVDEADIINSKRQNQDKAYNYIKKVK